MAIVTAFAISGLKLWFYSNDHEPPHFHAMRRGEWEIKVHFMMDAPNMVEILYGSPASKVLKKIIELAEHHRLELLEQWQSLRESERSE